MAEKNWKRLHGRRRANNQKFTDSLMKKWLKIYRKTGKKTDACKACLISLNTAMEYQAKDEIFREAIAEVDKQRSEAIWEEIERRAMNTCIITKETKDGTFNTYQGNDRMLELLARRDSPELWNVKKVEHSGKTEHKVIEVPAQTTAENSPLKSEEED